jgi:hypothetical protein
MGGGGILGRVFIAPGAPTSAAGAHDGTRLIRLVC